MASLESVKQKLYRARHHFDELNTELKLFYESQPGQFIQTTNSDGKFVIRYEEHRAMPARFGLICGDCLQCMRSSLDYLIWELVLAAGKTPGRSHMFPVALTEDGFRDDVAKRHRLKGIDPQAIKVIEDYQPFKMAVPNNHALAVLEYLSNINKHRRVLFTTVTGNFRKPPVEFPHMFGIIRRVTRDRSPLPDIPVWAYAIFKDGVVERMEITAVLDALARSLIEEMLPLFERFF